MTTSEREQSGRRRERARAVAVRRKPPVACISMIPLLMLATASFQTPAVRRGGRRTPAAAHRCRLRRPREPAAREAAPPRRGRDASVDGQLDEPQWRQAALLTGFSPVLAEGRRAGRRTPPRCSCGTRRRRSTSAFAPSRRHGAAARHARRPRQDRRGRQRAAPARHVQRRAAGHGVRREPARRAGGRHASSSRTRAARAASAARRSRAIRPT